MEKILDMMTCFNFTLMVNGETLPVTRIENFGDSKVKITKGLECDGRSLNRYIDEGERLSLQVICYSRDGLSERHYYQDNLTPKCLVIPELDAMKNAVLLETLILEEE